MTFSLRKNRCPSKLAEVQAIQARCNADAAKASGAAVNKIMAATQKILDAEGIHGDARTWAREHGFNTDDVPPPRPISKDDLDRRGAGLRSARGNCWQCWHLRAVLACRQWCAAGGGILRGLSSGSWRPAVAAAGRCYRALASAGGRPGSVQGVGPRVPEDCASRITSRAAGSQWCAGDRRQCADSTGSAGRAWRAPVASCPWAGLFAGADGAIGHDRDDDGTARDCRSAIVV